MSTRYPFAVIKEKLHAQRGSVADFAIGGRRIPLADELDQWIHANPGLALKAASPDDMASFREAAANYLRVEYKARVTEDQIVPVPSGRVGMSAFIACLLAPGEAVVVTEPGYPAFARMASHRHADVLQVMLDPEKGFAPDLDSLSDAERQRLRVIALNYPNNPTGAVISAETRAVIHAASAHTGAVIFNDAVYGPLTYEENSSCLLTNASGQMQGDDLVELHSLTKLYPLGPQSGSFLVGSAGSMRDIATYSEFAWAPMSALQVRATSWCLADRDGRQKIRNFYRQQLAELRDVLVRLGFEPYPTPSGIYALCRVPESIGGSRVASAAEAATVLMEKFSVAVVPFDVAGYSYLRFCSMFLPEDMQRLLAKAKNIIA
ncbi:MAG: pyridoxal phosphate-dependent aminotransferase [Gammaproteobacteria bacterium]|nr:pyridoxal phosphate-dependent aminotransferase [Gammaproteobacteria bacterium]MDH4316323.1 pyridoxal phosphate-dependent aminotransferase [Gammaproteobacteria bacterium]MDH5215126.1 pyridoxal phosphate-dependent aminotransferase [Gammaproteobacteria bacterium]MDH5499872.1 pyridoxal phosphate-dependent aminotransferase [Gammaproteobacteria bacterium]